MHQIKNFVVCNLIIPLGWAREVRRELAAHVQKAVLFYGPPGAGKYSMAKAVA